MDVVADPGNIGLLCFFVDLLDESREPGLLCFKEGFADPITVLILDEWVLDVEQELQLVVLCHQTLLECITESLHFFNAVLLA